MALPPVPAGLDLTQNRGPEMIGVLASTWAVGVIAVGARIWSRKLTGNKLWLDDWLIITSLLWSGAFMLNVTVYMVGKGFGKHVWVTPPDGVKSWAIGLFVAELTYTFSLVFVKLSILAFYWRIFSAHPSIKLPIWILFSMVIMWGTAVILVTVFQCLPVNAFWQRYDPVNPTPATEYYCGVNDNKFFDGNAIPNIITDALMMVLPIPYIWKLYLPTAQKLAITSIFVVGLLVTAVSIVRFTFILKVDLLSPDITWNFVDAMQWTSTEGNIATVCACLPSLKPLLNLVIYGRTNPSDGRSGRFSNGPTLVTIGGTENKGKDSSGSGKWGRPPRLNHNNYGTSLSHVTANRNNSRGSEAEHPFAELTDSESLTESQEGISLKKLPNKRKPAAAAVEAEQDGEEDGIIVRKDVRVESVVVETV